VARRSKKTVSSRPPVEFVGNLTTAREGFGVNNAQLNPSDLAASAQALETFGFEKTIVVYSSYSLDPFAVATAVSQHTDRLNTIIALRPNMMAPTVAAKAYATIDQINGGRTQAHFIAGGNDEDQWREGDFLTKDDRYRRMDEYIQILRRAWTASDPFDFQGEFYTLKDFVPRIQPHNKRHLPISAGGSSQAALEVGARRADIFGFFAEPRADIEQQSSRLRAVEREAQRREPLELMLDVRVLTGPTDEIAWEKAEAVFDRLDPAHKRQRGEKEIAKLGRPMGAEASRRILEIAKKGELHDDVLWTKIAAATGAVGSSAVLVGSYERVAGALADYYERGFRTLSLRGYGGIEEVIEQGEFILPRVRELTGSN
jgi:alkanesulfonate monooxygenase